MVTDGVNEISEPLLWSFGHGEAGQTYVFAHKGGLYESRVSFYASEKNLDFTIGAPRSTPATITDAIGQPLSDATARTCFGCHSTGGVFGSELVFENLVPGVRCEACHGPGEKHVAAMKSGDVSNKRIFNPAVLNGDRLSQEFCGACHRSVTDVLASPERRGVQSVRFQPYRIFNSKCYSEDRRISCTACHDPHRETERSATAYDSKCLACHTTTQTQANQVGAKSMASPHPATTTGCSTCHMPKIEVPGAHFKFTDHQIRVVKPGEIVPAE
ncbi:MAG: multiheme c-type cytochrome [Pyrinomonadaceae bacterium]